MEAFASLAAMAGAAFLSATILAAQSEVVFVALLAAQKVDPLALFVVAALANTAGSVVTWWMGRVAARGETRLPERWRPNPATIARAERRFSRFGGVALLFAWLPLAGELFVLAAGTLHYPLARFIPLVLVGKAVRYGALWAGWSALS